MSGIDNVENIEDFYSALLVKYLPHDKSALNFELSDYNIKSSGFRKTDGKPPVPAMPQIDKLYMLFHDLRNTEPSNRWLSQYLMETADKGPRSIYGTSGCGKTRGILEFLSHEYGIFFIILFPNGRRLQRPGYEPEQTSLFF